MTHNDENYPVSRLVGDAFGVPGLDSEFTCFYVTQLLDNWRSAEQSMRRAFFFIAVCAAAFELSSRSAVNEVSLIFATTSNTPVVTAALPVLIAFLYQQIMRELANTRSYSAILDEILTIRYPAIVRTELYVLAYPSAPFLMSSWRHPASRSKRTEGVVIAVDLTTGFMVLVLPPIYMAYAIVQLAQIGTPVPLLFVAGTLTMLLLLAGVSFLLVGLLKKDRS